MTIRCANYICHLASKGDSMATQPPITTDAPFGLQPNIAAFLAYFFNPVGAIIMMVGGGTNKYVKWAAAQAITFAITAVIIWVGYFILNIIGGLILHLVWFPIAWLLY